MVLDRGTCRRVPDSYSSNCELLNLPQGKSLAENQINCLSCKVGYEPIEFIDNFICLENQFMIGTPLANCQNYDSMEQCIRCIDGYYLYQNTCVSTCSQTIQNFSVHQNLDMRIEIIISKQCLDSSNGCRVQSIDASQEIANTMRCAVCHNTHIPLIAEGYVNETQFS